MTSAVAQQDITPLDEKLGENALKLGEIRKQIKDFRLICKPDFRQAIAESWPYTIDDSHAREDWGWQHEYDMPRMVEDMLLHLRQSIAESLKHVDF